MILVLLACGEKTTDLGNGERSPTQAHAPWDLVPIPGGAFVMGDSAGEPDERPREVVIGPFRFLRHEVTNRQFEDFVHETRYVTDPERSGVGNVWDVEWRLVHGANWRRPASPGSSIESLPNHPVVQVSARDAAAFCAHYEMRLPTEEEWEFAARGSEGRRYPWGDAPPEFPTGARRANFGTISCCAPDDRDGHLRTSPVGEFPSGASPFGILDMAGNVWEWTASEFPGRPGFVVLRGGGWGNDPYGLRASYRHANPPDIGLDMVGFRCAADPRDL